MKKIKKIPFLAIAAIPVIGVNFMSVSCGNIDEEYKQQIIDEFLGNKDLNIPGLVSVPRPGHYHDKIVPYLKQRIKDITGLSDDKILSDNYGNICFDIPATKGYENKETLILQGHTDMVVAGLPEEQWQTTPIDAVIDGNTIHSRGWKTSIGADDGAGVACALTIAKNRDKFNHGPLRIMLTADEDVGMIGASFVSPTWFKNNGKWVKWLINIDAENENHVYRSCAGNVRLIYSQQYNADATKLAHEYTLSIDGVIGGHSGTLAKKANADRLVYEFLYDVCKTSSVQLVEHNHIGTDGIDEKFSANQIINHAKLIFRSDLDETSIQNLWKARLNGWKTKYTDENWTTIEQKSSLVTSSTNKPVCPIEASKQLVKLFGNYEIDVSVDKLGAIYYGNFLMDKDFPLASSNIGPITISYDSATSKVKFDGWTSSRSSIGSQQSDERFSINWIHSQYKGLAHEIVQVEEGPIYYPWAKDENNELVQIVAQGYKKIGIEPIILDATAGTEPAWWTQISRGHTVCTCIGPHIDNAHNKTETLYIDTLVPVYKTLLYAIDEIAKKN